MKSRSSSSDVIQDIGIKVSRSCTIQRSGDELYRFWRDFKNLPRIMKNVVSVTETSPRQSHWVVKGPLKTDLEWDAEIINETPGELIAWKTTKHPSVDHAGTVRFQPAPGGRGTEVRVVLEYHPPGGKVGEMGAKMLSSDPGTQISQDLQRFKTLMETGEIPTIEGQPIGAGKENIK